MSQARFPRPGEWIAVLLAAALCTQGALAAESIVLRNQQSEVVFDVASGGVGDIRVLQDGQWQTTCAKAP